MGKRKGTDTLGTATTITQSAVRSTSDGGGVYITIQAKPGAKVSCITAIDDQCVSVSINAPAKDGKANTELMCFMASLMRLRQRDVTLQHGGKSKAKVVHVKTELAVEEVYTYLKEQIE